MPINQSWSEAELQQFITIGQEENLQLEFKRSTATNDQAKTEISKDVSAFANTIGGTIIYGIEEDSAEPRKAARINPLDPAAVSKEWLDQVINSRIQPRISGVRIIPIDVPTIEPGKVAYVVEVPESSTAHQASDKRYYRRFNFQAVMMEDYEIRLAMNRSTKPAYRVWFRAHQQSNNITFSATVVNVSEITPTIMSATLYVPWPENESWGEPWEFVSLEGIRFRRFQAYMDAQWNPGRQSTLSFQGAQRRFPSNVHFISALRIHLRLFDNWGLALHEAYDVAVPAMHNTLVFSESDRKPGTIL